MKKLENNKIIKILLAVLLVVSLVFAGTALGKYVVDKVLDGTITLNITGAPQGNILMAGDYGNGFAATIKALDGEGESLQKIVFCGKDELPATISDWDSGENVDAANRGTVKAFYDESTKTVYVASKDNEKIIANADSGYLFRQMTSLTAIEGLDFVDTSAAETMASMFQECSNLVSLDVSNFDTGNVKDMSRMFEYCNSLPSLDVSSFNTTQVTEMSAMFCFCENLDVLNLSNFDTSKVTNMNNMFYYCKGLESLDLSNFDTSNVEYMIGVFGWCSSLTNLNISSFDTSKVLSMNSMFEHCQSLTDLDVTGFDTTNVTDVSWMFYDCTNLQTLNLSSFNTQNFANMSTMFADCFSLTTIYVNKDWDVSHIVNSRVDTNGDGVVDDSESTGNGRGLFTGCNNLVGGQGTSYLDIFSSGDVYADDSNYAVIDKAQELQEDGTYGEKGYLTLYEAYTLTDGLTFSTAFNTLQMENMDATTITFGSYNELKGEIGDIWNDGTVTYKIVDDKGQGTIRAYLITNDYGTGIYVVSKDSSVIFANQDCSYMFDTMMSFVSLTNIWGLNNVDTRNTTNMSNMFAFNLELSDVDVSGFDTSNVTDMSAMFGGCTSLSWLDGISNFDTSKVTNMNGMFAQCPVYSLDVSGFDTSKVTNMGSMFASCTELWDLNLSKWNTSNVTNMASMFDDCTSLETIYAGAGWNTDKVTSHNLMFDNCTALVGGQGTAFDANYIDKTYALIDAAREPNGAKGYLTDANYGVNSKVLLPGGEFNAQLAELLTANEGITKVQFGDANQFSEVLDFSVWDDEAWKANADAILDVARSGNISAFVVGDTVYILAKETDHDDQYNSVIYANADCANMFRHNVGEETTYIPMGRLTAIEGLSLVDTGNTTTMAYMFSGCAGVSALDLSGFDTADVTDMNHMFSGCKSLGGLNLSSFNTSKVTNMESMFFDCDAITALNLSKWDVSKVTNMNAMFSNCDKLNTLNLTGWTTSNVTDMTAMFSGCPALKTIYVDTNWTTEKVAEDENMFNGCTALVGGQTTTLADTGNIVDKTYAVIDRYVSDGTRGYLTYEEAYTLVSGPVFNDILYQKDKTAIFKIVFGSFDQYKNELGITWESMEDETGLSYFDQEKKGNIRLHIVDGTRETEYGTTEKIYYILSKDSSSIIANEDCSNMFLNDWTWTYRDEGYLEEIVGLELIDTQYVTDMSYMFNSCNVETLNFSNFVTSNVTNMAGMFYDCSSLTTLDLSGFDTSNVTDMSSMFWYCYSLEELDLAGFDTSNVTDMHFMFCGMSVEKLDLSGFNTAKVTDMSDMFAKNQYLKELNILNFDTRKVSNMENMFDGCWGLEVIDLSSFSTDGKPNISYMFYDCKNLKTIMASDDWNPDNVQIGWESKVFTIDTTYEPYTSNLTGGEGTKHADTAYLYPDEDYKYARIDKKQSANDPGLFTDKNAIPTGDFTLKTGSEFNSAVSKLIADNNATKIQFGSWADYGKDVFDWYGDATAVTLDVDDKGIKAFVKDGTIYILSGGNMFANADSSTMFQDMSTLTAIDGLGNVNTGSVTNMSSMFRSCSRLSALDLSSWNTENVTNMNSMFRSCGGLTSLKASTWDTGAVENMAYMFSYCGALSDLDVSAWNTAKVTTMNSMFGNCSSLTELNLSAWNTGMVQYMSRMFSFSGLTQLDLSNWNTEKVTDMSYMFMDCTKLTQLSVNGLDTDTVTNMSSMFKNCSLLTELDISKWNTGNVENMSQMFSGSTELTTIFVSDLWSTANVTNSSSMFSSCNALVGGAGTVFDASYTDAVRAIIDGGTADPGYLTDINPIPTGDFTLKTGREVNTVIANSGASKVQFGSWADYGIANDFVWTDENAVTLDVDDKGIKAFVKDGTIYILSGGTMYANENSSSMFQHNLAGAGDPYEEGYIAEGQLTAIDGLANVNTSKVKNMSSMFMFCTSLAELDVTSFDTSLVEDMSYMFRDCCTLTELDVSGLETNNVGNMQEMFRYVSNLTTLDISNFDTANVTNMQGMFQDCDLLESIKGLGANYGTNKVQNMSYMFKGCDRLSSLTFGDNFKTTKVITMNSMFQDCTGLTSLDVSSFNTANVWDMTNMFRNLLGLTTLDVSGLDTSNVTTMRQMFWDLQNVEVLDLSGFNTANVTTMDGMFGDCKNLITIYVSDKWSTASITNSAEYVFNGAGQQPTKLTGGAGTKWSSSYTTVSRAKIDGGTANPGYLTAVPVTLTTGVKFNTAISGLFSETVTKLQFGTYDDVVGTNTELATLWNESTNFVDVDGEGTARVFTSGDTVYVLSEGSSPIYANADCAEMFAGYKITGSYYNTLYDYLKEIRGLEAVNTSKVTNMREMFYHLDNLTYVDVSGFDTSKVTSMSRLFAYCKVLTTLDVSNWDTGSVTSMQFTFCDCEALTTLDVSNWNTGSVTNMHRMFIGCSGLTTLDVSNWNTGSVESMDGVFYDCSGLTTLDVSNWNTGSVTSMSEMFRGCTKLTTLNVSTWNTGNVSSMSYMFYDCQKLTALDVSNWNTGNVKYMHYMFFCNYVLEGLDVSKWDTGNVQSTQRMFVYCYALSTLDVSNWNTINVKDMSFTFSGCSGLTTLDVSNWDTSNVTTMKYMFSRCAKLTTLDLSNWNTSNVTDMSYMFFQCTGLTTLDVSGLDTDSVTTMEYMFANCQKVDTLDVSKWSTVGVTTMSCMFNSCRALKTLDLSNFDTQNVTNMYYMFYGCANLETIYVSDLWTVDAVTESTSMFYSCDALVGGEGTAYSSSYVDKTYACIDKAISEGVRGYLTLNATYEFSPEGFRAAMTALNPTKIVFTQYAAYADKWDSATSLNNDETIKYFAEGTTVYVVSKGKFALTDGYTQGMFRDLTSLKEIEGLDRLDTSAVTNMEYWFYGCSSLTSVDLSGWNTSNVTTMLRMFEGCTALTSVNLSGIDTSNVTLMGAMFQDCSALENLDLSNFNTESVTELGDMFWGCTNLKTLDLSNFTTDKVTVAGALFSECTNLTTIWAKDWNLSGAAGNDGYVYTLFYNCTSLVGGNGTVWTDENSSNAYYARIDDPDNGRPGFFTDPAQKASASVLSLYDVSVTEVEEADDTEVVEPDSIEVEEADGTEVEDSEQDAATTEPEADSTVEEILPESQEKEETESEPEADSTVEEIFPESQEKEETESESDANNPNVEEKVN